MVARGPGEPPKVVDARFALELDVGEVHTFALFHYPVAGVRVRF